MISPSVLAVEFFRFRQPRGTCRPHADDLAPSSRRGPVADGLAARSGDPHDLGARSVVARRKVAGCGVRIRPREDLFALGGSRSSVNSGVEGRLSMSTPPQHGPLCLPVRFPAFRGRSTAASADPLEQRTRARGLFRWKGAAGSDPLLIGHTARTVRSEPHLAASEGFSATARHCSATWSRGCLAPVPPSALSRTTRLLHVRDHRFEKSAPTLELSNRLVTAKRYFHPPPRMSSAFFKKLQMIENKWFMHTDSHCFTGLGSPFALQRALEEHFSKQRTQRVGMPEPTALRTCTSSVPSTLRACTGAALDAAATRLWWPLHPTPRECDQVST